MMPIRAVVKSAVRIRGAVVKFGVRRPSAVVKSGVRRCRIRRTLESAVVKSPVRRCMKRVYAVVKFAVRTPDFTTVLYILLPIDTSYLTPRQQRYPRNRFPHLQPVVPRLRQAVLRTCWREAAFGFRSVEQLHAQSGSTTRRS